MTNNTAESFRTKWTRNPNLAFAETMDPGSEIHQWIVGRNGFADAEAFAAHLRDKSALLDAGCGNGRVTALLATLAPQATVTGIDLNAWDVAAENLKGLGNVKVRRADLMANLGELGKFDFIYCQEVLHHTEDPRRSFRNLVELLQPGGEIAIYVYRKKALVRELADDAIRGVITSLDADEAMVASRQIAELGRRLSEIGEEVEVPDIPLMGIEGGRYSVQRLIYHFFFKCFYNEQMGLEASAAVNFDWYHPQTASRHDIEEVREWFRDAGLDIVHEFSDPYGITLRGTSMRPGMQAT